MQPIDNLEIHLAHACNLTCESCSHYSNQGHKGIVSLEDGDRWMKLWHRRVSPAIFSLLGGEPTIHPQLTEFLVLSRRNWPTAHLRLATNGFFLHRHPDLPKVLQDPNTCVYLSIHHDSPEYQEKIKPARDLLTTWTARFGIRVHIEPAFKKWTRRYKGFGAGMEPYEDDQPRRSWENCRAKLGLQLHEGCIWKCAPLAYLPLQQAKYGLSQKWKPYLAYAPLQPTCSDEALADFLRREEESVCRMCSARPQEFELPLPLPGRQSFPLAEISSCAPLPSAA